MRAFATLTVFVVTPRPRDARDVKFTDQFKRILHDAGIELVRTAYQAPNMNAIAERWVAVGQVRVPQPDDPVR